MQFEKFRSSLEIIDTVNGLINNADLDSALHLIKDFVESVITEPACTAQVFGSRTFDRLCQEIGHESLSNTNRNLIAGDTDITNGNIVVFVVTKLQNSGGHTRVIQDFIAARPGYDYIIFSTELDGSSESTDNILVRMKPTNCRFEAAPKSSYAARLQWLQERLLQTKPVSIYLFNHHQDSVAVAAVQLGMSPSIYFYHHGDHHLTLGLYVEYFIHIDPHPMGYHNCRDALGLKNIYIPLAIRDEGIPISNREFLASGALKTCTAARSNKIEVPYYARYVEVIPALLSTTGGEHIHIGRLTLWARFQIRRQLRKLGVHQSKFIYIPWVQSVWRSLQNLEIDLYIASFPYGGGLTLIEAMGSGTPIALHTHTYSRILSGTELAYESAFSWRRPSELIAFCAGLDKQNLREAGALSRAHYEFCFSEGVLKSAIESDGATPPVRSGSKKQFVIDTDEWAFSMQKQMTLSRIASRSAFRKLKQLRAWWQALK